MRLHFFKITMQLLLPLGFFPESLNGPTSSRLISLVVFCFKRLNMGDWAKKAEDQEVSKLVLDFFLKDYLYN